MTTLDETGHGEHGEHGGREAARLLLCSLATHRKEIARLARAAEALAKPWTEPKAVGKAMQSVAGCAGAVPERMSAAAEEVVARVREWLRAEREGRRHKLASDLEAACTAERLELTVITREPLEVRIAPVAIEIDVDKGKAAVSFGRVPILECAARAGDILAAREKALGCLESGEWSPEAFHRRLRLAWDATRSSLGPAPAGAGVEMSEILPNLALAAQGQRWRLDPTSRNFRGYGKAQFLFDLYRLRRAGTLAVDGWRLLLGVATGDSTRDKRRVFWVEDAAGRGSYHLTLRFVREEDPLGGSPP